MSNENVLPVPAEIPEYLKALQDAGGDAANMAASSVSIPRISLRGRQFRFMEGGNEILKKSDFIDVIVLGVEPQGPLMIKTYYEKGYVPNSSEPPTCASDDGIRPSAWVTKKQSDNCAGCNWNQFGSATSPSGKPSKKCRDSKRMWLARADEQKPLEQRTVYGLNVTVMSLKAFADYGRTLLAHNITNQAMAITRLTMVDAEYPQLAFNCVGFITQEQVEPVKMLTEKKPWRMLTSAGLALAAPDDTSKPLALPGAVPNYVQEVQTKNSGAAPTEPVDTDTIVNKW